MAAFNTRFNKSRIDWTSSFLCFVRLKKNYLIQINKCPNTSVTK